MGYLIPSNKLGNLKLYKYSSEDHSIISKYILKKWWNHFVKIFPMSMAPNVITLLGLMFVIVNLFAVFYYSPYLDQSQPRWCYFFYAFGLFMYQTFDGCDGCHARNTGQSGPLGELFDHSIDAINTTLGCVCFRVQNGLRKIDIVDSICIGLQLLCFHLGRVPHSHLVSLVLQRPCRGYFDDLCCILHHWSFGTRYLGRSTLES